MLTRARFPGRSLDPIPWTTYFERELFLPAPDGSVAYHAYLTSPAPSSGPGKPPGPLFVTHHGAGSSGLSFAVLSAEIRKRLPSAGILSLDARGHGLTTTTRGEEAGSADAPAPAEDLTLATLAADLLAILRLTQSAMHWAALPPLLLVGHSLGGAVVTEFASVLLPSLSRQPPASTPAPPSTTTPISIATGATKATLPRRSPPAAAPAAPAAPAGTDPGLPSPPPPPAAAPPPSSPSPPATDTIDLLGYAVLDVVEGSALDALQSMHAYLATRPGGFETLRDGVEWHVRSRTVRNAVSARASVPGLLVCRAPSSSDDDDEGGKGKGGNKPWRWRTDLARTQPFWEGWFGGLSGKFLRGRGGKMLLLAGTDRLDTELTIGQMQGWFSFLFSSSSLGGRTMGSRTYRKIRAAGVPRGRALYPRGPAGEDGRRAGRLPPAE